MCTHYQSDDFGATRWEMWPLILSLWCILNGEAVKKNGIKEETVISLFPAQLTVSHFTWQQKRSLVCSLEPEPRLPVLVDDNKLTVLCEARWLSGIFDLSCARLCASGWCWKTETSPVGGTAPCGHQILKLCFHVTNQSRSQCPQILLWWLSYNDVENREKDLQRTSSTLHIFLGASTWLLRSPWVQTSVQLYYIKL